MVMFREDEQRMIAEERAAEPRWKKRLRLAVKIVFYAGCLFFLSLFILSGLGGKNDSLKKGLEQYLIQASGMVPEVGTLNGVTFFPIMSMNADNIVLYKPQPNVKPVKDMPLPHGGKTASAGHMAIDIAFWDMFFSRRLIRNLDIRDLRFEAGSVDENALSFSTIRLDPKGYKDGPAIVANGHHGNAAIKAVLQMEKTGRSYGVAKEAVFDLLVGKLHFAGTLKKNKKGALWTFSAFGGTDITGDILFHQASRITNLKASLHRNKTDMVLDMTLPHEKSWAGTLKVGTLDMADITPLLTLAAQMAVLWPDAKNVEDFVVTTEVDDLNAGGKGAGAFTFRLRKTGAILAACDFTGTLDAVKIGRREGQVISINRDGLKLSIPVHPECMQGTLASKNDGMVFDPLIMASRTLRLSGTGKIDMGSVNATLKPVPGTGCTP